MTRGTGAERTGAERRVRYRLVAPGPPPPAPELDPTQRAVVDHPGGPLLVLAGPGTGKTTTLIEAVVDRIEHRGLHPDQVLVLTFSRKAADQLRTRITARLGRTMATPLASTFHSFAYALLRRYAAGRPVRAATAAAERTRAGLPARRAAAREHRIRHGALAGRARRRPPDPRPRAGGPCGAVQGPSARARPRRPGTHRGGGGPARVGRGRRVLARVPRVLDAAGRPRLRRARPPRGAARRVLRRTRRAARPVPARSSSTSTRTPTRRRSRLLQALAGRRS